MKAWLNPKSVMPVAAPSIICLFSLIGGLKKDMDGINVMTSIVNENLLYNHPRYAFDVCI